MFESISFVACLHCFSTYLIVEIIYHWHWVIHTTVYDEVSYLIELLDEYSILFAVKNHVFALL